MSRRTIVRSPQSAVAVLTFFGAAALGAQPPTVSGAFVSTLGVDTIAVEKYTRTGDKLEGHLLIRYPSTRIVHYVADLSGGKFKGMAFNSRPVAADPATPPILSITTLIGDTTATVDVQRNGRPDTTATTRRTFRGRGVPSVPGVPPAFGLYEQILAFNAPTGTDSVVLSVLGAGRGPNGSLAMTRRGRDTLLFMSSFAPGWVEIVSVDANGRITGADATATTVKSMTRRVSVLDIDALAKRWAADEAERGRPLAMSPRDTASAKIGAAGIEVVYSRPMKRGRVIFGPVVKWNEPWRTGANAATQFTTSADLMFGNTLVPAGKYTLWTLPTPTGAKLIINSQTGQWGTEYDPKRDFTRLDLTQTAVAKPVEQFTIAMDPQGTGAVLRLSWDDREYSVPFRVK